MKRDVTVLGIVGSYRKGGTIDSVVDEVLQAARRKGASTRKIYLIDQHIEFCTNCRTCSQLEGTEPGECIHQDDMERLIRDIRKADAIVLGSPMNFGTVTAVTKRFIERLMCLAYWPWGMKVPKMRSPDTDKPAVIVASSAAPAILQRWSGSMLKLLRQTVELLGAHPIGEINVGLAAMKRRHELPANIVAKAHRLGERLVARVPAQPASAA
ncbi:MAG: flavodoxin family protein [Opitutaceae bacterium]